MNEMNQDYQKFDDVMKTLICKPMYEFNSRRPRKAILEDACHLLYRHVIKIVNNLSEECRYRQIYLDRALVLFNFIWGGLRGENNDAVRSYLSNENFLKEPFMVNE